MRLAGGFSIRLGMLFSKLGLSPNAWTVLALLPALFGFVELYNGNAINGAVLFLVSGFMDVIDGAVARVTKATTTKGAFLDGLIDRYVEILLYLGILAYLLNTPVAEFIIPHAYWVCLLVFSALMPSFITAYADHRGVIRDKDDLPRMGGLMERAERLGVVILGLIATLYQSLYLVYAVVFVIVFSNITALQRIRFVLSRGKKS